MRENAIDPERIEIWFQDEARIGQKNKITRRWAKRSYARKLVTERSGGALGLFYPVLEQHSLDDLHELV